MPKRQQRPHGALKRIRHIQAQIARFDYVCSGTVLTRTKVCGKPGCRCATDPEARHGPYHEWSRREGDRLVHSIVSSSEARVLGRAIRNYRAIQRLLRNWQDQSVKAIRTGKGPASKRKNE
jgi:hypothetical protein